MLTGRRAFLKVNNAEPDMICPQIALLELPSSRAVARAVIRCAQERTAFDDVLGPSRPRFIGGPLPDIADHIVQTERVRFETPHGRARCEPGFAQILCREDTLLVVGLRFARGGLGVGHHVRSGPCCKFPLGFGR